MVVYTFTGLAPGAYRVSATWVPTSINATNAPYTMTGGIPETVRLNQQLAPATYPNSFVDSGSTWADLDVAYVITGNTLTVTLSNDANGYITGDAIRIEQLVNAELRVLQGSTELEDGVSMSDFGATSVGSPSRSPSGVDHRVMCCSEPRCSVVVWNRRGPVKSTQPFT